MGINEIILHLSKLLFSDRKRVPKYNENLLRRGLYKKVVKLRNW
jgi:hypothetical protein